MFSVRLSVIETCITLIRKAVKKVSIDGRIKVSFLCECVNGRHPQVSN
jgi:hypothetical protein